LPQQQASKEREFRSLLQTAGGMFFDAQRQVLLLLLLKWGARHCCSYNRYFDARRSSVNYTSLRQCRWWKRQVGRSSQISIFRYFAARRSCLAAAASSKTGASKLLTLAVASNAAQMWPQCCDLYT
jgi:hypothetical protein